MLNKLYDMGILGKLPPVVLILPSDNDRYGRKAIRYREQSDGICHLQKETSGRSDSTEDGRDSVRREYQVHPWSGLTFHRLSNPSSKVISALDRRPSRTPRCSLHVRWRIS
jgi:hypothetical protein